MLYFWCKECDYDDVLDAKTLAIPPARVCPLCLEDNGRTSILFRRLALDTDKPEGPDARKGGYRG